jgi:hypothetical protein
MVLNIHKCGVRGDEISLTKIWRACKITQIIIFSNNIVVFKTVYPSTFAYFWLTNTTRMTHLEDLHSTTILGTQI